MVNKKCEECKKKKANAFIKGKEVCQSCYYDLKYGPSKAPSSLQKWWDKLMKHSK